MDGKTGERKVKRRIRVLEGMPGGLCFVPIRHLVDSFSWFLGCSKMFRVLLDLKKILEEIFLFGKELFSLIKFHC